jgi:hypothetical protein
MRLLAQISSTTSNELGPDPPNNLTNVHRYRRVSMRTNRSMMGDFLCIAIYISAAVMI